jgi:hypothetical protein
MEEFYKSFIDIASGTSKHIFFPHLITFSEFLILHNYKLGRKIDFKLLLRFNVSENILKR